MTRTDIVFRGTSFEAIIEGLEVLGLVMNGTSCMTPEQGFYTPTPLVTKYGDYVVTVILTDEQLELVPEVTSPNFLIDWVDGLVDENDKPVPFPKNYDMEREELDEFGVPTGVMIQYTQSAGVIVK